MTILAAMVGVMPSYLADAGIVVDLDWDRGGVVHRLITTNSTYGGGPGGRLHAGGLSASAGTLRHGEGLPVPVPHGRGHLKGLSALAIIVACY